MDQITFKEAESLKAQISNIEYLINQVDEIIEQFHWKLHDQEPAEASYLLKIVERDLETYEDEALKEMALSQSFYDYLQNRKSELKTKKQELEAEFEAL